MDDRRLTKGIYGANVYGSVGRGLPGRTFTNQIDFIPKKDHVKSTKKRRKCMQRLMNVEEEKEVCQALKNCLCISI